MGLCSSGAWRISAAICLIRATASEFALTASASVAGFAGIGGAAGDCWVAVMFSVMGTSGKDSG